MKTDNSEEAPEMTAIELQVQTMIVPKSEKPQQ
jgi:hypothetical protein